MRKWIFLWFAITFTAVHAAEMPRTVYKNGYHNLIVDGEPFMILGAQVGNSSAWPSEMEEIWPVVKAMHCNTVQAPIYWEAVEPEQGKFDFTTVDSLVDGARKHDLKLILAWFGSYKNGKMDYVPAWMKEDNDTYPRVINSGGKPIRVLSPHYDSTLQAEIRAYEEFVSHVRDRDKKEKTVILLQIQNEPGYLGACRDHSARAEKQFNGEVPVNALKAFDSKKKGNWQDVFEADADEIFTAFHLSTYINALAEAGKRIYPLDTFVNV